MGERLIGEGRSAVAVDAVAAFDLAAGEGIERIVGETLGEILAGDGEKTGRSVIRSDIGGVGGNGDGIGEENLLPAGGGFVGEGGLSEEAAVCGPQVSEVGTGVVLRFVETQTGDEARQTGAELDAQFNRARIKHHRLCRGRILIPETDSNDWKISGGQSR